MLNLKDFCSLVEACRTAQKNKNNFATKHAAEAVKQFHTRKCNQAEQAADEALLELLQIFDQIPKSTGYRAFVKDFEQLRNLQKSSTVYQRAACIEFDKKHLSNTLF